MYQDETEKELEENGFRITSGDGDDGEPLMDMPDDDDLDLGLDEEDPDHDS